MTDPLAWMAQGNCVGEPVDVFFVDQGESANLARSICAGCQVREECLDFALTEGIQHGFWGGHNVRERRRLRKARLS